MIVLPIVAAELPMHTGIIKTRLAAVWNSKSNSGCRLHRTASTFERPWRRPPGRPVD
jgi:hypothetical protein